MFEMVLSKPLVLLLKIFLILFRAHRIMIREVSLIITVAFMWRPSFWDKYSEKLYEMQRDNCDGFIFLNCRIPAWNRVKKRTATQVYSSKFCESFQWSYTIELLRLACFVKIYHQAIKLFIVLSQNIWRPLRMFKRNWSMESFILRIVRIFVTLSFKLLLINLSG